MMAYLISMRKIVKPNLNRVGLARMFVAVIAALLNVTRRSLMTPWATTPPTMTMREKRPMARAKNRGEEMLEVNVMSVCSLQRFDSCVAVAENIC